MKSTILTYMFFIFLLTASANGSTDNKQALDNVTLQLKWLHQFQFAGYYAAIKKGYYRDIGLDVTLVEGKPGLNPTVEVLEGRANYGINTPILLLERNRGLPVVVIAAIFQHSPEILLTRKDSGIKNPHDLAGKKIMIRRDGNIEVRMMLIKEGIHEDNVTFIDHSWNYQDLVSRKVDAVTAYITDQPFSLLKKSIPSITIQPITYGVDFYGDCLFTSEKEIQRYPERTKKFLSASIRGWEYAMSHEDEIIDLIINKYSNTKSRDSLRFEAEEMKSLILSKYIEVGHMNPGRWNHIAAAYVELQMLDRNYSLEGFLYDPDPAQDYRYLKTAIIGTSAAAIIISMLLLIFNYRLKKAVNNRTDELNKSNIELKSEIENRKKAEESLKESELKNREIIEKAPYPVLMIDSDDNITYINQKYVETFGYTHDKIPRLKDWWERAYPDPEYRQEVIEAWEKVKIIANDSKRVIIPVERKVSCNDGSVKNIEYRMVTVGAHFLIIMSDLTELKRAQTIMIQTEKMITVGGLAAGMAHEINNPLGIILQGVQGTENRLSPDKPENRRIAEKYNTSIEDILGYLNERKILTYFKGIKEAGERAAEIISNMLQFSRKSESRMMLHNINSIILRAIETASKDYDLDRKYDFRKIRVTKILDNSLPEIMCVPSEIEQVILNLLRNAAQAMISSLQADANPEIKIISKISGDYAEMEFADNGPGIEKTVLKHIFEPFYTTKEVGSGTGLGLSVSYFIITNNHNGFIYAESEKGKGTKFTIKLPLN